MKHLIVILLQLCSASLIAQQAKYVVVLGFDGMSPNGIKNANTPNFNELIKNGSHSFHARAVMPTSSSPNWASMIMGAPPKEHGIHSNKWKRENIRKKSYCGRKKGEIFPTIFGVLKQQKPESKIACFYHWNGFARLTDKDAFEKLDNTANENITAEKAAEYIVKEKPNFLFLHFDHVDHAGHEIGHGTAEYFASVGKADSLTGVVMTTLKQAGIFEQTVILVTADHGGKGKGHGGMSMEEIEIPWIISGPGIKKGFEITDRVETYFTAPTLAKLFGLTAPDCWTGKAVNSCFE